MALWQDAHSTIHQHLLEKAQILSGMGPPAATVGPLQYTHSTTYAASVSPTRVCTGSEWYYFPSHFFLPDNAELHFLKDGFGGVLPQHFARIDGTSAVPLQPFNDENKEETSRYVPLATCDFVVLLVDFNRKRDSSTWKGDQQHKSRDLELDGLRSHLLYQYENSLPLGERLSYNGYAFVVSASQQVLSPAYSHSSLSRAYYVPFLSAASVKYQSYVLLKQLQQ
jgi:hypothetical protein